MHETTIELKLEEEMKPIANLCEKIEKMLETDFDCGMENVHIEMAGKSVDMIKDLCDSKEKIAKACYYKQIVKAMEEAKKEDEEEDKYMLKRFKEEYGDEDGERRYYDDYRYMRSGRFAPKGRGTYDPRSGGRRGYSEPRYYTMTPDMYREHEPEYYRDMDRHEGRMYYTETGRSSGSYNGSSNGRGMTGGNMGGSRYYSGEGEYSTGRDRREGKSGRSRRGYMETKEMRSDNSAESKQHRMKELESYTKELAEDVTEMISDASAEEKSLLKQKLQVLIQKI